MIEKHVWPETYELSERDRSEYPHKVYARDHSIKDVLKRYPEAEVIRYRISDNVFRYTDIEVGDKTARQIKKEMKAIDKEIKQRQNAYWAEREKLRKNANRPRKQERSKQNIGGYFPDGF